MPRRPKDPADAFSYTDLAIASALTKRGVRFMAEAGLLPGDGGIRDLKRMCVIGAFVLAGADLFSAGRVAQKLRWAFNEVDGEIPSFLKDFERKVGRDAFPSDKPIDDYWRHRAALARPDIYTPGTVFPHDIYFDIAEREHVFMRVDRFGKRLFQYQGRIEGWERGGDVSFVSLGEAPEEEWPELKKAAEARFAKAVGVLSVNASLAIRNGLDRLAEYRAGKLAP
jgi:hypothetical protein